MSILSRYLDPETLSRVADRPLEPRGLVHGNLAGAHKSPLSGFAIEFAGHREYVPGDDPKHVDWRLYFTKEKYFVKQYEMETNFVAHLLLDVSASMRYGDGDERKLTYAAQLATTLGYSIVKQNDTVSLGTFDDRVRGWVQPSNAMAQIVRMTEHLDGIEPVEKTAMAECLMELTSRTRRREIVMVFSDFLTDLDTLEDALQQLRFRNHEVVLFHVLHHSERTFDFEGMVKFVGIEMGDDYLTQTEDVRRGYLRALESFEERFREMCARNRVELVPVDTSRNKAEVLIDYLNTRSQMARSR